MAINRDKVLESAQKFVEKKKYDKAVVELRKLVEADPTDARTLLKIGDLQAKQLAFADAIGTYESVGRLYASQGFALKAIAVYKQIREIIAKHVPQLEERYGHIAPKLAELYQQLGLTSDALAALDEVATRLQRQQKDQEAIEVFRKIVELDPTNPLPHLRLAEALSRIKDTEGAVFEFKTAASQLASIGRRDDALKVLERLLHHKPDPEQAKVCAELYLSRGQPQDGMQALAKLQICFQANPRDFDTLSLLARAFNAIGQGAKAIEVQKEMARIARDTGKQDLFREILERLMRVAPHDEGVRRLSQQAGGSAANIPAAAPVRQQPAPQPPTTDRGGFAPATNREFPSPGPGAAFAQTQQASPMRAQAPSQPAYQPPPPPPSPPSPGYPRAITQPLEPARETFDSEEAEAIDDVEELTDSAYLEEVDEEGSVTRDAVDSYAEVSYSEELDAEGGYASEENVAAPAGGYDAGGYEAGGYDAGGYESGGYEQSPQQPQYATNYEGGYAEEPAYAESGEVAEQAPQELDHIEYVAKMLADANAFRRVRLYAKALETLRLGLEVDPRSMDLHEVYRDVLIESGQTDDAVQEMLVIAGLYVDALDGESAARALQDVLAFDPHNQRAIEMLQELGYEIVDEEAPQGAPQLDAPQLETSEAEYYPDEAPLPAYDLERGSSADLDEVAAHYGDRPEMRELGETATEAESFATEPPSADALPSFPLDEPDTSDAYATVDPLVPSVRPFRRDSLGTSGAPVDDGWSAAPGPALSSRAPSNAPRQTPSIAAAASRDLEDALEEAEFFCSRGLYDDARAILVEQLGKHPNNPLLRERLQEIDTQEAQRGSGARERPQADRDPFDLGQSLDALESLDYPDIEPAEGHANEEQQVDVEEVFAKFKEGVAKQISVDDSDSHYNLGIAYKEMLLLDDAIREFDVAAMDPKRECVCRSMIGMIHIERGNVNEAIEAFLQGLNAAVKDPTQETVLCYEIGAAYEVKKQTKDALAYYQKAMRRDPNYRDVQERVRRLSKLEPKQSVRQVAVGADDEFDRAFDDLLSKA